MQCSSRTMYCHPERCTVVPNDVMSSRAKRGIWASNRSRVSVTVRPYRIPGFARDDTRIAEHWVCRGLVPVPPSPIPRPPSPIPHPYRGIPATIRVIVLSCRATTFRRESRSVCNWAISFFKPPISFAASLSACATAASERGLPQAALNSAALETRSRRSGRMSCRDRG